MPVLKVLVEVDVLNKREGLRVLDELSEAVGWNHIEPLELDGVRVDGDLDPLDE